MPTTDGTRDTRLPAQPAAGRATLTALALPVLGAIGLGLCFPPWNRTFLLWFAIAPVAALLQIERPPRAVYGSAFVAGLAFALLALDWMRTCYAAGSLLGPMAASWIGVGEIMAAGFVASVFIGRRLVRRTTWPMAVCLPLFWVTAEFVWYHLGTLLAAQPFPWLQVGLPLGQATLVAQMADVGGIWLVSAFVAFVNGCIADCVLVWIANRRRRAISTPIARTMLACSASVAAVALYGQYRIANDPAHPGPRVALVSSRLAPDLASKDGSSLETQPVLRVPSPALEGVDILLYPELACPYALAVGAASDQPREATGIAAVSFAHGEQVLATIADTTDCTLLVGLSREQQDRQPVERFNSILCARPGMGLSGVYDKINLVAFREAMPAHVPGRLLSREGMLTPGGARNAFIVSTRSGGRLYHAGAGICYDVAFSDHFRVSAWNVPGGGSIDFFVCASDEVPTAGDALQQTLLLMTRYRAIETRRSVVRNVTGGFSGIVDSRGRLVDAPAGKSDRDIVLAGPVPVGSETTLYGSFGRWFPDAVVAVVLLALLRGRPASRRIPLVGIVGRNPILSRGWSVLVAVAIALAVTCTFIDGLETTCIAIAAPAQPRERPDTPTGRLLDKLEEQNVEPTRFHDPWLRTLKAIVDLGPEAVPELLAELDATDNDMMLRCCGFTLRALGDKRAVPALIRAIPKTLLPSSSDYGLRSEDAELAKWAQEHDLDPFSGKGNQYSFARPVREIFGALNKLTGQKMSEGELFHMFLDGVASQRRLKRELFYREAKRWADWWDDHADEYRQDAAYARANLPEPPPEAAEAAEAPAADTHYKTRGGSSGWILQSVLDPKSRQTFYDLDTGRVAALPEKWRKAENIEAVMDEILAWAFREKFDLMGTEYAAPDGQRYYALKAIGLRAWELDANRWKMKSDDITAEALQAEGAPAGGLLLHFDQAAQALDPKVTASFLYVTRSGTPGVLFVGIQVTDNSLKPGGIAMGDQELEPVAFYKGRRFGFSDFEEVK